MVAGIILVGISMLVFSMATMILAGSQVDESNPLYRFASLFSGFIQTVEQRHQEATQFKENLGKEEATIKSIPDIEEDISSSVEPQELVEDTPQNEIEDSKAIRSGPIQMGESEPEAETITEEPEETSKDFSLIQGLGGSANGKYTSPAVQIYQEPIGITGQFDEESQSWQLSVSGTGFSPDASLMVIISTVDSESSTIASFTVQTNGNGNFSYSPGTLYNNL